MSTATQAPAARQPEQQHEPELPIVVKTADGRVFNGQLPAARHRSLHLGLLHQATREYVELAAWKRVAGKKPDQTTRWDPGHFLPGGASEHPRWRAQILRLAERHISAGEEVFIGVAPRHEQRGLKEAVTHTRFLWLDVDEPDNLPLLDEFTKERPAHLIVESAGSGGRHALWQLNAPLPALTVVDASGNTIPNPRIRTLYDDAGDPRGREYYDAPTGEVITDVREVFEWIETAHQRLVGALGGDPASKDRSRILRLAGSVNYKSGAWARIVRADLHLEPYDVRALIGDLPDPKPAGKRVGVLVDHDDPYRRISPPEYFRRIAGIEVPSSGWVQCPNANHDDHHPSCQVWADAERGFYCFSCDQGGGIYDLASLVEGGPSGRALRGEDFKRAKARVEEVFGQL